MLIYESYLFYTMSVKSTTHKQERFEAKRAMGYPMSAHRKRILLEPPCSALKVGFHWDIR